MKLYGLILLFLIVIMIFTGTEGEKENFNIFQDVEKAINNAFVLAGGASSIAVNTADYAKGAIGAADQSSRSIPDAIQQARNMNSYMKLMRDRVANCGSAVKELWGSGKSPLQPIADCKIIPSRMGKLKCYIKNGKAHTANAISLAKKASKIQNNFKKNYKKHFESETCKEMRLALQERIDKGVNIPTARETLDHLAQCNTCGDRFSAMLAKPLDTSKITEISVNATKTISQWPQITKSINTLTDVASRLET